MGTADQLSRPIEVKNVLKYSFFLFGKNQMQVFINNDQDKRVNKKRRGQLDPQETTAFLNRPVKKIENLNQSLKNSYGKNFFKESRFEHFDALKKIRKGQDNDSIASSQHDAEDYKHRKQKKIFSFSYEQQMPKKVTGAHQQSRKIKERRSRSRQAIPAGKCHKKMAKRHPTKKIESSPSSSSRNSSRNSYKSSLERNYKDSARQINTRKADGSLTDEKLDSSTKQEAPAKLEQSFSPQKRIALSIIENAQTQKYSSSELSDQPEHIPLDTAKAQSVNLMNKIINRVHQQEQALHQEQSQSQRQSQDDLMYESSIESVKIVFDEQQEQIAKEQPLQREQNKPILQSDSKPMDVPPRSSKLTLNSKVIVESLYITSNSKSPILPTKFGMNLQEQLAKLFVHAPCCIYSQGKNHEREENSQSDEQEDPKQTQPKRHNHNKHCSKVPQQQDQTFSNKSQIRKQIKTRVIHESDRHGRTS